MMRDPGSIQCSIMALRVSALRFGTFENNFRRYSIRLPLYGMSVGRWMSSLCRPTSWEMAAAPLWHRPHDPVQGQGPRKDWPGGGGGAKLANLSV